MRRFLALCLIFAVTIVSFTACTAPYKTIDGVTYQDYGLLNQEDRNPNIYYEPNWRNIIIAILFSELIIPPVYVFGFHLMKPVGPMPSQPGQVN